MAVGASRCFCCDLTVGLHFSNLLLLAMLTMDLLFTQSYNAANMQFGGLLAPQYADNSVILWAYGIVTVAIGTAGVTTSPSRKKGVFLSLWKALLIGFMVIWTVHAFQTIVTFSIFELDYLIDAVFRKYNLNSLPVFRWVSTAIEWYIIDSLPDNGWAVWVARNWSCVVYFGFMVPITLMAVSLSHVNMYIRVTRQGRVSFSDGLVMRKEERDRRLAEKQALLTADN